MSFIAERNVDVEVRLPEILSALSFALDLTEGAVPGHSVRSTLIGMRLGIALGLEDSVLSCLYYALQMKDIGCSSNAARMAQLFGGQEQKAKAVMKLSDLTGLLGTGSVLGFSAKLHHFTANVRAVPRSGRMLWRTVLPDAGVLQKLGRFWELGKHAETNTRELITLRCDRGAKILRTLNMHESSCASVRHLDERWDGNGYPDGLAGQEIPLLARISSIAQTLDAFATAFGTSESVRILEGRSGVWFDPEIVRLALHLHRNGTLWTDCEPGCEVEVTRATAVRMAVEEPKALRANQIDNICEAFAGVVDAKSPFTFRHSIGVRMATDALCEGLGLPTERQTLLRRAALLHDLGKLGVPNGILDKPGKLTAEERRVILAHPEMSRTILNRIAAFGEIARLAGQHHERLDGSGYPEGLTADQLGLEIRVLAVADCFAALAEDRPYRKALPLDEVLTILHGEAHKKLDPFIVSVLESVVNGWGGVFPARSEQALEMQACASPEPCLAQA